MHRHFSTILCATVAALLALGLTMLASTGAWVKNTEPHQFLILQSKWVGVGLVAAVVVACIPLEKFRKWAIPVMIITCIMLALCFVPGVGSEIYGSKRWIKIPGLTSFQPSEAAKLVVVFCLACWFARWPTETRTFWRGFVIPGVIAAIPVGLIAAETDVGTALSLSVAIAAIFFTVGSRLIYLVPTALLGMSAAYGYIRYDAVRWKRIEAWLDLENPIHQLDRGMQQWRALLALGNGGPWGVGLGNGNEKFGTLTFAHIDFIFPVIGEELGLVATLGVVCCYFVITLTGFGIAIQAKSVLERCMALGLTCVITVPSMVNIAVTTATFPNDGLPLPFISYGGTSVVFSLVAVGLLVGIHRRNLVRPERAEFLITPETRLAVKL